MKKTIMTLLTCILLFASANTMADKQTVKKIIKYRKKTTIDLTGSVIKSKARTPDVFYVFRRKRTTGGTLKKLPSNFNYHHSLTLMKGYEVIK